MNTALRCVITVPVERIGLFMCPEEQVGLCLGVSQNMANGDVAVILHLFFFFCNVSLIKKCVSSANIKVHCWFNYRKERSRTISPLHDHLTLLHERMEELR